MFDYFDIKDALKSQFNYLTPGEAPYYFIVIGIEIFLYKAAHELSLSAWFWAAALGMLLMAVCLLSAIFQRWENDVDTERSHIRIARIVGVSVPLVAVAITMEKTKHTPELMVGAILVAFFQAFVFLFFVKEKPLQKGRSINIPQLIVICSSLVFSIQFSLSSMSGRFYLVSLPEAMIISAGERVVRISEAKAAAAEYDAMKSDQEALNRANNEMYERNKIAQGILDEDGVMPIIPANSIASEMQFGAKGAGVPRLAVDIARRQLGNLLILVSFLFMAWVIVLGRTFIYSVTKS
ncbi:MAG: hypothetical protein ACOY82_17245 [Pseudomonadota bacterium]